MLVFCLTRASRVKTNPATHLDFCLATFSLGINPEEVLMKKLILASTLVFGFMSPAFALNETTSTPKQISFPSVMAQSVHPMSTASDVKIAMNLPASCDPKGAACFEDNSETCCSKTCVFSLCE
jgi:hypothetical protein